ncbi:MAG: tetratricopeptide repeat protein [Planctomycetota bacterium]|jgi:tetratricopeptide (TPR) repeat protein
MRQVICSAALLLAAGSICATATTATEPGKTPRRLAVATLWFEDKTGDPNAGHWRYAIERLLANQLREVKAIRLRPGVEYARRELGISKGASLDPAQARKMGELIEAQRVIWGSYSRQDDQWRGEAYVLNVASGQASDVLSATSADWYDVRDSLGEQLVKELRLAPSDEEKKKMLRRPTSSAVALEWYSKAYALQAEGKPLSQAEDCERKAIEADPNFARAYIALASTLGSQGKLAQAEQAVRQALKIRPDSAYTRTILGTLFLGQRKAAEAERQLREAHRLNPDFAEPLDRLGQLYGAQHKWDQAIAFANQARILDPTNPSIHASLAYAYVHKRQADKALAELKDAERLLRPEGMESLNAEQLICQAYRLLGEIPKAVEHFDRFVAMARKQGVNPQMVGQFEQEAQRLRESLTPSFIEASMPKVYTKQTLQEALRGKLTEDELQMVVNPLGGNAQMKRWARELTQNAETDLDKAKAIFEGLIRRIQPEGAHGTRTAQEVFEAWNTPEESFSCQEFAKLFVALARDVSVTAFCVAVERDYKDKVVTHMCAAVFSDDKALLLDPTYLWFGVPHKESVILDDLQAIAYHLTQYEGPDSEEAARCRIAVKLDPNCPAAYHNLAGALIRDNQWEQARQAVKELEKRRPDYWGVYLRRGALASHEGDLEAAAGHLRKALELYPLEPASHYRLGLVLAEQGMLEEAREQYRACLRCQPPPGLAGDAHRKIAQINESIGVEQTLPDGFVSGDELEQAILGYTKALENNPRDTGAYVNRASAYLVKGEYDLAISDCTRALEIKPTLAQAYGNRGLAYLKNGNPDGAISDFNKVLEIDPRDAKAYYHRAIACHNQGQWDKAISDFTKALEIEPGSVEAYGNRGLSYLGKDEPDRAISDFNKVLKMDPRDAIAYANRALAYIYKDKYDEAISDCNEALKIDPKLAEAYSTRARAYTKKGEPDKAIADCNKALEINPSLADAYRTRGFAYKAKGLYDQAIADFEQFQEMTRQEAP